MPLSIYQSFSFSVFQFSGLPDFSVFRFSGFPVFRFPVCPFSGLPVYRFSVFPVLSVVLCPHVCRLVQQRFTLVSGGEKGAYPCLDLILLENGALTSLVMFESPPMNTSANSHFLDRFDPLTGVTVSAWKSFPILKTHDVHAASHPRTCQHTTSVVPARLSVEGLCLFESLWASRVRGMGGSAVDPVQGIYIAQRLFRFIPAVTLGHVSLSPVAHASPRSRRNRSNRRPCENIGATC